MDEWEIDKPKIVYMNPEKTVRIVVVFRKKGFLEIV